MQQIVFRCWLVSRIEMCAAEADAGAGEAATAGLVIIWRASSTLQPKHAATGCHTISQLLVARQLGHPATNGSTRCSRHRVKIRASMPCAMGRRPTAPVRWAGVARTLRNLRPVQGSPPSPSHRVIIECQANRSQHE
jgi:hypothetical protein